jgi:alpha-D-xyloside xylohydrolase
MRPLFFDFRGDENCIPVDDQFMFGPDLLVAPVLHEVAWVPARGDNLDRRLDCDKVIEGGQWVTANAPLERIPLFLRREASLPIRVAEA